MTQAEKEARFWELDAREDLSWAEAAEWNELGRELHIDPGTFEVEDDEA